MDARKKTDPPHEIRFVPFSAEEINRPYVPIGPRPSTVVETFDLSPEATEIVLRRFKDKMRDAKCAREEGADRIIFYPAGELPPAMLDLRMGDLEKRVDLLGAAVEALADAYLGGVPEV